MKILLAVDGSSYSRMAIDFIASRKTLIQSNPHIEVLNVRWPLPPHPARVVGMAVVRDYYADEAEKALKPARTRLAKAGLSPVVRYTVGRPALEISRTADKEDVDLLVMGSHGHSALGGMLLGSITQEVLVRSQRPILIVRGRKTKKYPDSLRLGIGVDGSAYGPAVLRFVLRHPALFGGTPGISLIHVAHRYDLLGMPSVAGFAPPAFSAAEVRAMQAKAYEAAMKPMRRLLKSAGVKATEVRLVGVAGDELSGYAKKKLDVLAMGSHGYGALKGTVLGSVATRVVAHGEVPLLLIRSVTDQARRRGRR